MHTNHNRSSQPPKGPITDWSGLELSAAIHARHVSCREVMDAYLERIDRLNPALNAMVSRAPNEALLAQADVCDKELAQGRSRGWMHGMPQAIKDTGSAVGFPTTYGSPLLAQNYPAQDSAVAARMKAAGCIVVGKTNVPEFGLGSHTFNTVFGATPNAWDRTVTAGGSSGGAAVALAHRLLPVADGSDFMGSLRNPAAWANVFGMRPSQGRVPMWPVADGWVSQLATEGPMARNVADLTALLATQAGRLANSPLSITEAHGQFPTRIAPADHRRIRVGWLGNLNGYLPMDADLLSLLDQSLISWQGHGAQIVEMTLDTNLSQLWEAWLVWRRALVAPRVAAAMKTPADRARVKPEALWEHDQGQGLGFMDFMRASEVRTAFHSTVLAMFEQCDVLAMPVTQVWPFAVDERWPTSIAGREMDTYHRWMESTLYATFAGLPAISVPAGFHANGRWPAGLQLMGPPQGDVALLEIAGAWEQIMGDVIGRRPPEPVV